MDKREQEIAELRGQIAKQETQYDDLRGQFERYMTTHPDDLTAIRGIGRIYQWKLRDGGISSYAHLANTTPERLREILEVPTWRKFEPESWIEQAKVLTQRSE
jgi:predicted flap endonuclease-1-like 5' DNA nuclease